MKDIKLDICQYMTDLIIVNWPEDSNFKLSQEPPNGEAGISISIEDNPEDLLVAIIDELHNHIKSSGAVFGIRAGTFRVKVVGIRAVNIPTENTFDIHLIMEYYG